jgi:hypothetical protein
MGLVIVMGVLVACFVALAARVPAVWAGSPTPLHNAGGIWFGRSRRTHLLVVLALNVSTGGLFLLFAEMEFTIDPLWQIGTILAVFGTPLVVVVWMVVAAFNRPRFLVAPDQRLHRKD